ncbi:MAG: hypothetical protein AAF416_04695 [Pseudomonadota bacterium]
MSAMILASSLPSSDAWAETTCPGGDVKSFVELAERLGELEDLTVLGAELLVSPTRACRETWVVEILNEEDEVRALLLDARTLEIRIVGDGGLRTAEEDDEDFRISHILLEGRPTPDLIEGDWSDDEMHGGPGRDVFVVTPGSDVILDFEPNEDLLEFGDFARVEEGFGTLQSLAEVTGASRMIRWEGRSALQIDIDGAVSDWSVTLVGVGLGDLTAENTHFGDEELPEAFEPTHWPERTAEFSDGTIVLFEPYPIAAPPPGGELLEGDPHVLEQVRDVLQGIFEDIDGEDE